MPSNTTGLRQNPLRRVLWLAAATGFLGLLTFSGSTAAQMASELYTDVPADAWYSEAADALLESGALDSAETRFRPSDLATRAEVMKLLTNLFNEPLIPPARPSFSDVPTSAWYYKHIEAAARMGWLRGDNNCYGTGSENCTARPAANVNRAEMAAILQRAFQLPELQLAPRFPDASGGQWYSGPIQAAADHCILMGDDVTGLVRPASNMNRAEMIVMFHRAQQQWRYGRDCAEPTGDLVTVTAVDKSRVRVTFNIDLDPNVIDEIARYEITGGGEIDIIDTTVINARTIELELESALRSDTDYRLEVTNMRTKNGQLFDSDMVIDLDDQGTEGIEISSVFGSGNLIRIRFNGDINRSQATNLSRYGLTNSAGSSLEISQATATDNRTVELRLRNNLGSGTGYTLRVNSLGTANGETFTGSRTFQTPTVTGGIRSVDIVSDRRIHVDFNTTIDEDDATAVARYAVTTLGRNIPIARVLRLDSDTVEIFLDEGLQFQNAYTVAVNNMGVASGMFNDNIDFVFSTTPVQFTAALTGNSEVPSVNTTATGTGTFTLSANGLQYDISVKNMGSGAITGAHFHLGDIGVSGPVIEPISFSSFRSTGTWTDLTAEDRRDLLNGDIYVNIHTAAYPNGEIRGQLLR